MLEGENTLWFIPNKKIYQVILPKCRKYHLGGLEIHIYRPEKITRMSRKHHRSLAGGQLGVATHSNFWRVFNI